MAITKLTKEEKSNLIDEVEKFLIEDFGVSFEEAYKSFFTIFNNWIADLETEGSHRDSRMVAEDIYLSFKRFGK